MAKMIRIDEAAHAWNHPAGMWWDSHIGETFPVIQLHDGIPRQYEVDVSSLPDMEAFRGRAFVPAAYVTPVESE